MIARYGDTDYGYSEAGYGYGVSAFTGFDGLSIIPDTLGWWSVARRVLNRYNGPAIRLRRSSDSAEQDFYGIGPQGEVSTADVRAWNGWNLLRHTDAFNETAWAKSAASISQNATTSPSGELIADKLIEDLTTNLHQTNQTLSSVTSGATYTFSVNLKAAERSKVYLVLSGPFAITPTVLYTLSGSGSSSVSQGTPTRSITSLGDGWYRCTISAVAENTTNLISIIRLAGPADAGFYTGDGASGVFICNAQLERASSFSTYEPRGANAAGDSFLVTLYDQSGLARHFTQSTTTLQPIICEQGVPVTENGRLAAKFVAADARRMSIASSTAMFNALHTTGGTVLAVIRANDTAASKIVFANHSSATGPGARLNINNSENALWQVGRLDVAGVATAGNSISVTQTGTAGASRAIIVARIDPDNATAASRLIAWSNGSALVTDNAESGTPFVENATSDMTLGAVPGGTGPFDGPISELALFSDLISTADRTAYQSRSGVFYGVTIS